MRGCIIMLKGQCLFSYNLSMSENRKGFSFAIGMSKWMDGCGAMLNDHWIILS